MKEIESDRNKNIINRNGWRLLRVATVVFLPFAITLSDKTPKNIEVSALSESSLTPITCKNCLPEGYCPRGETYIVVSEAACKSNGSACMANADCSDNSCLVKREIAVCVPYVDLTPPKPTFTLPCPAGEKYIVDSDGSSCIKQ